MALPVNEPFSEESIQCQSTSIGASPVAASVVAPCRGRIVRTFCVVSSGTTTGAGTVAVTTTVSASDIGALALPIGAAKTATSDAPTGTTYVNEGDVVTFTPASGGGASVVGNFCCVIRK